MWYWAVKRATAFFSQCALDLKRFRTRLETSPSPVGPAVWGLDTFLWSVNDEMLAYFGIRSSRRTNGRRCSPRTVSLIITLRVNLVSVFMRYRKTFQSTIERKHWNVTSGIQHEQLLIDFRIAYSHKGKHAALR